jgi:hypothetical protein
VLRGKAHCLDAKSLLPPIMLSFSTITLPQAFENLKGRTLFVLEEQIRDVKKKRQIRTAFSFFLHSPFFPVSEILDSSIEDWGFVSESC